MIELRFGFAGETESLETIGRKLADELARAAELVNESRSAHNLAFR